MHVCMVWFSWHKIPIWSHKNLCFLNFNYVFLIRELAEGLETLLSWPWDIPQLIELPFLGGKYCHRILKQDLSLCYIKAFIPRESSLNFTFFFYLGFLSQPFMNHKTAGEDQGQLLSTTSICFTDTYSLVKQLLQKAHLCTQVGAGFEPGTFGFQVQIANH